MGLQNLNKTKNLPVQKNIGNESLIMGNFSL